MSFIYDLLIVNPYHLYYHKAYWLYNCRFCVIYDIFHLLLDNISVISHRNLTLLSSLFRDIM